MWYNLSQRGVSMLKIKVNFDRRTYQVLLNDMKMFKILKNDKSPNKNKFMNLLFENYYQDYITETEMIIDKATKLMKKYELNNHDFAAELAMELFDYKHQSLNTYYTESLTFYLSEKNEFIFNTLNASLAHLGASAFFRKLIYQYLEYPQYKREQIIYKQLILQINEAIEHQQCLFLKLEKSEITMKPYKIGTSKEEIYTYLLGISNGIPASIHILKIKAIIPLKQPFTFDNEEKKMLSDVYRLGIQFPFKNICKAEIELDAAGIRLYEAKYLNRPDIVKIEGNHYFFECSFDQLLLYFMPFGSRIKIISPNYLAKSIYKSYKGYTDYYEATNNIE